MPDGIDVRHKTKCALRRRGARCTCSPSYRARLWVPYERRHLIRTFPTRAAARSWLIDSQRGVEARAVSAARGMTLTQAADDLFAAMVSGAARTRSGDPYKPAAVRTYRAAFATHVRESLGARHLDRLRRRDLQALVDRMAAAGSSPSTIRNALMPIRVVYRRALRDGIVVSSPLDHLDLPADRGRRDRVASPAEALELLAVVPDADRLLWGLALLAGLRRGEILALRVEDIDLGAGVIHVRRSWDPAAAVFVEPKSAAGHRRVPLADHLRTIVAEHLVRSGRRRGLLLAHPSDTERPGDERPAVHRARAAWKAADLSPIGLHEARHAFASLAIAAGIDAKSLSEFMGHAAIAITMDRYGHLLPGAETAAASRLDGLLREARSTP